MRGYSVDLGARIVRAVEQGMGKAEAARRHEVGLSTVKRFVRRQARGALRPGVLDAGAEAALRAQVAAHLDATVAEHRRRWADERGGAVSAARRADAADLDPATLVFLDESGTHVALAPRYARAPRGQRAYGRVPHNRGDNITLVAALTPGGPGPAMTLAGAADGPAFGAYVRELPLPTLVPGQAVILDNLAVHQRAAVRRLVEARGCRLLFLPPYSPDYDPIEPAFAKLKASLRRAAARTRADLETALAAALGTISPAETAGWFRHCGYHPPDQPL